MARVIKAGVGQKPARAPARVVMDAGGKKVIERELFQAKQDAEHILRRAEEERQKIVAEGKRSASQAREEAMVRGASEAFAAAAGEALLAFRRRAERYGEAADDIRALALEVVRKILGTEPDLSVADVDRVMQKGLAQLRARRRLRLQVAPQRLAELGTERPNLMKALQSEPDLIIEAASDVSVGFARVVTEVGGALCAEETALDALSSAVNVHEQPRARVEPRVVEETHIGLAPSRGGPARRAIQSPSPSGFASRSQSQVHSQSQLQSQSQSQSQSQIPSQEDGRSQLESRSSSRAERPSDESREDSGEVMRPAAPRAGQRPMHEARVRPLDLDEFEEVEDGDVPFDAPDDDGPDERARHRSPGSPPNPTRVRMSDRGDADDAEEDDDADESMATAHGRFERGNAGADPFARRPSRVVVRASPASAVMAIDLRTDEGAPVGGPRKPQPRPHAQADDDVSAQDGGDGEDLDLFMDDAVSSRKRS